MISIIIPTLNEEKVLARTILFIQKMKLHTYEIIISDGKSKDNTIAIAKSHGCRVVEYIGTARQTISMARNMGAEVAVGEYLVFLDADVIIPDADEFFTKAIEHFAKDPKLTGFAPFIDYIQDEATRADKFFGGMQNMIYLISNNILHKGQSCGEFQMVRRSVFEKIKGYNEKLAAGEDVEFFSRLADIGHTRIDRHLHVYQATRRIRATGWPKLLMSWFVNWLYVFVFNKSFSKVWHEVR